MFCPSCGQQNPEEARFCGNCGRALPTSPSLTQVPPQKELDKSLKRKRAWMTFLFSLIVMFPTIVINNLIQYTDSTVGFLETELFAIFFLFIFSQAALSFIAGLTLLRLKKGAQLEDAITATVEGLLLGHISDFELSFSFITYMLFTVLVCILFGFMGGYLGRKMRKT